MPIRTVSGSTTSPVASADTTAAQRKVWEGLPPGVRQNPEVRKKFGLGDAVAVIARPFARLLGRTNCQSCKDRQDALNRRVPSLNPFRSGQP